MKPWPAELLAMFPRQVSDEASDRPWWRVNRETLLRTRRDRYLSTGPEAARDLDASHPLPHPGFRPGQLWAEVKGDGTVNASLITAVETTGGLELWLFHGRWMDRADLELRLTGCFLVTDAACPHLAPWAPPEKP